MVDISDIPGILRRNVIWLLFGPLITVPLALAFLALRTPSYITGVEILIEPQGGIQVLANSPSSGFSGLELQNVELESQSFIVLSAQVLDDVADKLGLDDDPALHRPRLLKRLLGDTAPREMTALQKRAKTIANLRDRIAVERLGRSFVFMIAVEHPDAVMAAAIANEIAESYLENSSRNRSELISRASSKLGKQALALRQRVEAAENAVEAYKSEKGLISTGTSGLVVDQQIQALNNQIAQAQAELERAKAANDLMTSLTLADVEAGALPQTQETNILDSLRVQYAQTAQQEAQAATTLGVNHPVLRELRSQLQDTQRQIRSELQRTKRTIQSRYEQAQGTLAALQAQSRALQSQNSEQGRSQVELRQLELEAESSRSVYEAFLRRAKELEEQPEVDTNESRILTRAPIPSKANGPNTLVVLAAAVLFGLALPAGLCVALALVRGQINSERQLVEETGLPIVSLVPDYRPASIPVLGSLVHWITGAKHRSENQKRLALSRVAYALRQDFEGQDSANILILAMSGRGKSSEAISREIAVQLYDMGEDVLLAKTADAADVTEQRPSPKRRTQRRNERIGVLAKLAGKTEISKQPTEQPLARRSSGGLSRYLSVERLHNGRKYADGRLLADAEENFLIIDVGLAQESPFLPVLLRHCDGVLLVSSIGETKKGDLDKTLAYLQPWQDRVIGNVVLEAA